MPETSKYLALATRHSEHRISYVMKQHVLAFTQRSGQNDEKEYCQVRLSDGSVFETTTPFEEILSAMSE